MKKHEMRDYIADLESYLRHSLQKWKGDEKIENGEAVQLTYQFEQSRIILDIFWEDGQERVNMTCNSPRQHNHHEFVGLTPETIRRIVDRAGNFAQIVMHYRKVDE